MDIRRITMKWMRKRISLTRALPKPRYRHRRQLLDIVTEHADPLHRRIRPRFIEELVDRILAYEPDAASFETLDVRGQLAVLVLHALQACKDISDLDREKHHDFEAFSQDFYRLRSPEAKLRRIREYIEQTESDPKKRRDDIAATNEFLEYDTLNERHTRAREERAAAIEVALGFIGGALGELTNPATMGDEPFPRVLVAGEVDTKLAQYLDSGYRWQNRLAALRALVNLYVNLHAVGQFGAADSSVFRTVAGLIDNERENPWLQIAAARILSVFPPPERYARLYRRLVLDSGTRPNTDFLVRRSLVDSSLDYLPPDQFEDLLDALIQIEDPSEHVRMGIAHVLARAGSETAMQALDLLRIKETSRSVRSARVLATCAIAAATLLSNTSPDEFDLVAMATAHLLQSLLASEKDRLVLETAAEESVVVTRALVGTDSSYLIATVRDTLLERRTDPTLHASVHEALSAAAEKLELLGSETRARWTEYLAEKTLAIRPGTSKTISLNKTPEGLPPLPESPVWLGRILADLARRDWGLSSTRKGNKLELWRGDAFRRRMWRILHELTHPTPNKRQAFPHTIGRRQHGEVRAHPGSMDEVTATTVPGERVVVDTEGSWGRHLPLVDDLLDLPLFGTKRVTICSSHGAVHLSPPSSFLARLRNRFKLSLRYRKLALLRVSSLRASEPQERRRYLEAVNREYGITCTYEPYMYGEDPDNKPAPSPHVASLLPRTSLALALPALVPLWDDFRHWLDEKIPYFLDPSGNSQTALALFAGALASIIFTEAYYKRTTITKSRNKVPLSIGGWGTRGKSGTERIKAGLFHGMGYHTFTKTTGCEAMFINSLPGQTSLEVFIYRPYNKATIWEQKTLIELAAKVGAEVFLWECMALNPLYVRLLQHVWMRDDLVTLTNAFPDHEDIQGPAGQNVAQVITNFIPPKRVVFTTETNFLPLFRDQCEKMQTELVAVSPREGDLIAQDVLDLFPYQEHPRNIALVARMAEYLGIERTFAMVMMAEHVVPDLGVLKTYPTVKLRGRTISFVNGMSANERAGCLNNWKRMGCDKLDVETEPERCVITVVNNRDDRISRSEVFARIMVEDLVVHRHVVIGTNLRGLMGFVENALDNFVPTLEVLGGDSESAASPEQRLAIHMARLRIPRPSAATLMKHLRLYASGGELTVAPESASQLETRLQELLEPSTSATVEVAEVREALQKDANLVQLLKLALVAPSSVDHADELDDKTPEILAPASVDSIIKHFLFLLARTVVHARLAARAAAAASNSSAVGAFHELFWDAYKGLFREQIDVVENSASTGDQVIDRCIEAGAPGTRIMLLGIQNIKGTGLDFVYRWVALDTVVSALDAAQSRDQSKREIALRELGAFGDHGMVDSGLARIVLSKMPTEHLSAQEAQQLERVQQRVERIYKERLAKLDQVGGSSMTDSFLTWLEGWFDNLDSIRRYRQSKNVNRNIVDHRISLARAAIEMRDIYARQKGGWLAKLIKSRKK